LTALVAQHDPQRHERFAARWLSLYLAAVTLDDAAVVLGLLRALGGPRHDEALLALTDMAERATSRRASS
jgi:hypothetical protein